MEAGYSHQPPPFTGQEGRSNPSIGRLKTNSLPVYRPHRSIVPNKPHSYAQVFLTGYHKSLEGDYLSSTRRRHLRRMFDCFWKCVMNRKVGIAARFLQVLIRAPEWKADVEWRFALALLGLTPSLDHDQGRTEAGTPEETSNQRESEARDRRTKFLQTLDLSSTSFFKAKCLTEELVVEYISANRLSEAIELLEARVSVFPYKNQPNLHCYLGMLYLFVGVQMLLNQNQNQNQSRGRPTEAVRVQEESDEEEQATGSRSSETGQEPSIAAFGSGVDLRKLDRTTRDKSLRCFTQTISSTKVWMDNEQQRRQRIWYMHRKDQKQSQAKLDPQRRKVWGYDPNLDPFFDLKFGDIEDGDDDDDDDIEREEADVVDEEDICPDEGRRSAIRQRQSAPHARVGDGRNQDQGTQTSQKKFHHGDRNKEGEVEEEQEEEEEDEAPPKRNGPTLWAETWPEVAESWRVDPPWSWYVAKEYLDLLMPPSTRQRNRHSKGEHSATATDLDSSAAGVEAREAEEDLAAVENESEDADDDDDISHVFLEGKSKRRKVTRKGGTDTARVKREREEVEESGHSRQFDLTNNEGHGPRGFTAEGSSSRPGTSDSALGNTNSNARRPDLPPEPRDQSLRQGPSSPNVSSPPARQPALLEQPPRPFGAGMLGRTGSSSLFGSSSVPSLGSYMPDQRSESEAPTPTPAKQDSSPTHRVEHMLAVHSVQPQQAPSPAAQHEQHQQQQRHEMQQGSPPSKRPPKHGHQHDILLPQTGASVSANEDPEPSESYTNTTQRSPKRRKDKNRKDKKKDKKKVMMKASAGF